MLLSSRSTELTIIDELGRTKEHINVPYGAFLSKQDGAITAGEIIANWDPHSTPIYVKCKVNEFFDFIEGIPITKQTDELTGLSSIVVIDPAQRPMLVKRCVHG